MAKIERTTELLIACWLMGDEKRPRIPTSHGVLDRALSRAKERDAFPPWFWDALHFVQSRVGLQCLELPAMLEWAQDAQLTVAPNPSYVHTQVQVSPMFAAHLLEELKVPRSDAARWGKALHEAVAEVERELTLAPTPATT